MGLLCEAYGPIQDGPLDAQLEDDEQCVHLHLEGLSYCSLHKNFGSAGSRFRRNPWAARDVKRHNKRCADRKACRRKWPKIANAVLRDSGDEGKAIRIANWQVKRMGLRRRNYRRNPYSYRRHNPYSYYHNSYSYRRHNPYYYHNPSDEDDMRMVSETLNNMTPCDKKDWGLARRYRHYHRNPEPVSHTMCPDCYRAQTGKELVERPSARLARTQKNMKVVCSWCQKVVYDPNDPYTD
jgi:hypothetical protein